MKLIQLEEIYQSALEYIGNSVEEANKLTVNYYRRDVYEGGIWTGTAGPVDKEFEAFVHSRYGENSPIRATDPVTREPIDTPHMMATMSAIISDFIWVGMHTQDYAGWAGDLYTVAIDAYDHRNEPKYAGSNLLESTYNAAYAHIGSRSLESNMKFEDWLSDFDAVNIAKEVLSDPSMSIVDIIRNYYEEEVFTRYNRFFNNKFVSNEDTLRLAARSAMVSLDPALVSLRIVLGTDTNVPNYTDEEGIKIADAFSDKLMEHVRNEVSM
ncbi:hypothetical protein [Bacillus canaveralius]|uniref:hypothetical protein n=1 Tax=Bacillus canaveralius TaxID=1403243 RepID=UPI000F7739F7|nr:hypothetical protein [Bacillus canaveralius]RSK44879.1 hypothetical protein EJA13_20465 [Bacillus canaveralius]